MSYHRDFTIGRRETLDFYLSLVLRRWRRGILGFGAVGALAAFLYTGRAQFSLPVRAGLMAAGALVFMLAVTQWLVLTTSAKVGSQLRRSGQAGDGDQRPRRPRHRGQKPREDGF